MGWFVKQDFSCRAKILYSRNSELFWLPGRQKIEMVLPEESRSKGLFRWAFGPSRDWCELAVAAMAVRQRLALIAILQNSLAPLLWRDGGDWPVTNKCPPLDQSLECLQEELAESRFTLYCLEDMTIEENAAGDLRLVDDYAIVVAPRTIAIEPPKEGNPSEPIPGGTDHIDS